MGEIFSAKLNWDNHLGKQLDRGLAGRMCKQWFNDLLQNRLATFFGLKTVSEIILKLMAKQQIYDI